MPPISLAPVSEQYRRIVDQLEQRFPAAAALLDEAAADLLAFTFPKEHWRQLWSTDENVIHEGAGLVKVTDCGR